MFTGIIEALGIVVERRGLPEGGQRLGVRDPWKGSGPAMGESVAVDGVCLTVDGLRAGVLSFSVSPETMRRTTLGSLAPGQALNLERAMMPSSRLGGHLVLGHVDGVGRVTWVRPASAGLEMGFEVPEALLPYIAEKGSIAVNGVSLTVAGLQPRGFWVALVPYTLEHTNLRTLGSSAAVNVEVDVLARYVRHQLMLAHLAGTPGGIESGPEPGAPAEREPLSVSLLMRHGFIAQPHRQGGE